MRGFLTDEQYENWKIKQEELRIENEFLRATPEAIKKFREEISEEERGRFDAWYDKLNKDYELLYSLSEKPAPPPKPKMSLTKFRLIQKLEKLLRQCDEQQQNSGLTEELI